MDPYGVPNTPQQELQFLKDRAEMIRQELGAIDSRIQELEVEKTERGKPS
jgi:prefoldin subunit 5